MESQPFKMSITEWGKTYNIENRTSGVTLDEIFEDFIYLLKCMGFGEDVIATKFKQQVGEAVEQVEEIYYEEPTSAMEAVNIANYALSTLEMIDIDHEKLTESGKRAIARIKKQSLKLLSWGVQELHDSIFDETNE